MDERDLRRWANHFKYGGFQQYLLGNHPFEDCAVPVIEELHDKNRNHLLDVLSRIDLVIKALLADKPADRVITELADDLEAIKDMLANRYDIQTVKVEPPKVEVLSPPTQAPKPREPPEMTQPPALDCDILSMMG